MPDVVRTHLPGLFGSAEFMEAYAAAIASVAPPVEIGASRAVAGTVDAAIVAYYNSVAFGDPATENALALSTQKMRRAIFERFRTDHGSKRIALTSLPCWLPENRRYSANF
jgi:hypothetical protein